MKKAFENIYISRPVFEGKTISFEVAENVQIDELTWSLDSIKGIF
jgi:hypothetical protein